MFYRELYTENQVSRPSSPLPKILPVGWEGIPENNINEIGTALSEMKNNKDPDKDRLK